MTCSSAVSAIGPAPVPAGRLSCTAAFYLLASITVSFLAGSSAPTPLYPIYQAEWGFSPITVTVVFGIYALAVLSALLVVGRLSDHVGRKPVLIIATVAQVATMLVFATADGVVELLVARVIQGLSTGAAVAAVGAGLLDLDKARGTIANAIAPLVGTASGSIATGVMVQYLPAPTQAVYLALSAIFIVQGIGVVLMTESIAPRSGALASLKPQFSVPAAVRGPLLIAVPALVAIWALAGFYASLGPSLLRTLLGINSTLVGGLVLFVLAGSGAVSVFLLQRHEPRTMMVFGAMALIVGVAVAIAALSYHSATAFFVGTFLSGLGFGAGFQGAVRTVVPFAAPQERAGVLSVIFVISYLALGLPAVVAGYLVAYQGGIFTTAREFGAVVMVLAALALLGMVARRSK
jgi:MFS family permease